MANLSDTIALTCDLIRQPSVTPEDAGCQEMMIARLEALGFEITRLRFGEVDNFWACRGTEGKSLVFAGHTDVVPTGSLDDWDTDPFDPVIKGDLIYGRGAADMKGSLAAMVTACERFVAANPNHSGRIGFLITSDEEGPAIDGTVKVVEYLQNEGIAVDMCLVGEPSSTSRLGDIIKNGRRGSLNARLTVKGVQGHVAYPHLADNPIHRAAPALAELAAQQWDQGNEFFPPTTFQISNINSGTGATNVIPGTVEALFNFRFSTESTAAGLKERAEAILARHELDHDIEWNLSGEPFLTAKGSLVDGAVNAIEKITGESTELSTAGGTSDGRFIAPMGAEVLELGPINATIHKANECVSVSDLDTLSAVYEQLMVELLT